MKRPEPPKNMRRSPVRAKNYFAPAGDTRTLKAKETELEATLEDVSKYSSFFYRQSQMVVFFGAAIAFLQVSYQTYVYAAKGIWAPYSALDFLTGLKYEIKHELLAQALKAISPGVALMAVGFIGMLAVQPFISKGIR